MTGIKFDEEKVRNCIESFYEMNGRYPYLICSKETIKIIPKPKFETYSIKDSNLTINKSYVENTLTDELINEISVIGRTFVDKEKIKDNEYGAWYNATILIDNKLPFGEVILG